MIEYVTKLPELFRFMYLKVILSRPIFFDEGTRLNFGEVVAIQSVTPTVFCSPERKSSVLRKTKTDVRNKWGRITSVIWRY